MAFYGPGFFVVLKNDINGAFIMGPKPKLISTAANTYLRVIIGPHFLFVILA